MKRFWRQVVRLAMASAVAWASATGARAQDAAPGQPDHAQMQMAASSPWMFMQDGVLFAEFNHQGGPRGGDEFIVPNWWMGMATRNTSRGQFTFTGMLSLDPATVGTDGYREIFQTGEAFNGRPLVDRQHPHDFFMQLAAVWRMPLNATTGLTVSGGPAGEPALGPTAFMHRAAAADNPTAPLGHHTFDSTHVSFGVVSAGVDHGPWTVEGSVFNGREPDQDRWDFDFGRMDSVSGRVWFRPDAHWELQASTGHLTSPEQLEPGNIQRSTASVSWTRIGGTDLDAATAGYGRNDSDHGGRQAVFIEGTHRAGANTGYLRFEALQIETGVLQHIRSGELADTKDAIVAFTIGGVRDLPRIRGFETGLGADLTFYRTPDVLRTAYGARPISLHVFFRLRPPAGAMGRMWNMRMARPMSH